MSHSAINQEAQSNPVALFVSDLHLQPEMPKTLEAFFHFLNVDARSASQLYILGDLFEYWIGDDAIDTPFYHDIVKQLRAVHDAGTQLFWIAGNRDFLVGDRFAQETGLILLPDPSTINIGDKRIALAHGDAQCTDDIAYMAFRKQVRQSQWQSQFLGLPMTQRMEIVKGLRAGSKSEQKDKTMAIMDVNSDAIEQLFRATQAQVLIHGHTHRPDVHQHPQGLRYVLPDWDCDTLTQRGGWLAINAEGTITRHLLSNELI